MLKSSYTKDKIEAGCDEVGRGCLAGPVVAAAVILPKKYKHKLLTDSKQLKKKDREQLQEEIKGAALAWAVAEVSHEEIDEINILNASFKAMHLALDKLKEQPEFLLIDGNRFKPYRAIDYKCIVKGDSKYLSIAAASVLAKTYRDDLMEKLANEFPGYGWATNVGYPTLEHREGIRTLGITPYHRKSFQLLPWQLELFD
ncbi:MAG: ribonuclease HII [Cytophagales bacterium]|jgi:ribonuclease HII|nr:ribonuclease HII [Cytophagales bacterium]MCA6386860.1 ribonuclease HII [Cytophagales bacterium]MCA6390839.1 ribonuclease HII [Cytophagales bacterium]MCA6396613.1 ribonuclease HII [Cytophagales bacterium]MCA6397545.1 ribonuclease HII [Cytophagales bacterium]